MSEVIIKLTNEQAETLETMVEYYMCQYHKFKVSKETEFKTNIWNIIQEALCKYDEKNQAHVFRFKRLKEKLRKKGN